MRIGVLINARLGSKRLPKKHLRDIGGKTAMDRLLERVMICDGVKFIIATGDEHGNKDLEPIALTRGIDIFYGDPLNIPNRHRQIAEKYGLDAIVSLDADDVLVSPTALRDVIAALQEGYMLVRTEGLPLGMNCLWAYTKVLLDEVITNPSGSGSGDTAWGWVFDNIDVHRIHYTIKNADKIRLTMDFPADLRLLRTIYELYPDETMDDDKKLCEWLLANRICNINKAHIPT